MSKEDIGKKVIVSPAWDDKYDIYTGKYRGHRGEIIAFKPYYDLYGIAEGETDDDGLYIVRTGNDDLRLRRFDLKFADD